jgi:hypothetical protein
MHAPNGNKIRILPMSIIIVHSGFGQSQIIIMSKHIYGENGNIYKHKKHIFYIVDVDIVSMRLVKVYKTLNLIRPRIRGNSGQWE